MTTLAPSNWKIESGSWIRTFVSRRNVFGTRLGYHLRLDPFPSGMVRLMGVDVIDKTFVERVPRERARIAEDDEQPPRARHADVHAARIAEKTDLAFVIGP